MVQFERNQWVDRPISKARAKSVRTRTRRTLACGYRRHLHGTEDRKGGIMQRPPAPPPPPWDRQPRRYPPPDRSTARHSFTPTNPGPSSAGRQGRYSPPTGAGGSQFARPASQYSPPPSRISPVAPRGPVGARRGVDPASRRHPAAQSRAAVTLLSVGGFVGIIGGLAATAPVATTGSAPPAGTPATAPAAAPSPAASPAAAKMSTASVPQPSPSPVVTHAAVPSVPVPAPTHAAAV